MDCIENKVAFGMVFDDAYIHEDSLQPGCVRVLVDGVIQGDALIPVPIPGQMEKVFQVVGSQVAWPLNLISFTSAQVCFSIFCQYFSHFCSIFKWPQK